ncbi:YveK family protein [Furfurilactobacillus curtus]|uniref:Capsular polysaccharide biosynthesis protein CpsC n=1 Tax=Furfurilactobacillus curtus TaxID=1746200 RepID=A0ABQ5JNU7_9LACO
MDNLMELKWLVQLLRKKFWLIIVSSVLCGGAGFAAAKFLINSEYTATTQILIRKQGPVGENQNGTAIDQQTASQLVSTYKDLVTNQVVLQDVSDTLKKSQAKWAKSLSVNQLKRAITVDGEESSRVLTINVAADKAAQAQMVAKRLGSVYKADTKKMMGMDNVAVIVDDVHSVRTSPSQQLFMIAGLVAGCLISMGLILARELMDQTIKTDNYLIDHWRLKNLGHIGLIEHRH